MATTPVGESHEQKRLVGWTRFSCSAHTHRLRPHDCITKPLPATLLEPLTTSPTRAACLQPPVQTFSPVSWLGTSQSARSFQSNFIPEITELHSWKHSSAGSHRSHGNNSPFSMCGIVGLQEFLCIIQQKPQTTWGTWTMKQQWG